MNIKVRYYTKSGNTKKLADSIAERLEVKAEPIDVPLEESCDILFLGCSVYAFSLAPEVKRFISEISQPIGKVVLFGTSAMGRSKYKAVKKLLSAKGIALDLREFHCKGEFNGSNKGKPDENDMNAASDFASSVIA